MSELSFAAPDEQKFPALRLAREVASAKGSAAVVLNAANEVAVEAFLQRRIKFTRIVQIAEQCLNQSALVEPESIAHIQELDSQARKLAATFIQ